MSQLRTAPSCLLSSLQNSAASESGEVALLILNWKVFGQSCACFPLLFLSAWLHRVNPDPRRPLRPSVLCKNVGYEFSVNKTNPDHPSPQFSSCEDFLLPLSFHCRRVLKQIQLVIFTLPSEVEPYELVIPSHFDLPCLVCISRNKSHLSVIVLLLSHEQHQQFFGIV